jgi:hypothetical protein
MSYFKHWRSKCKLMNSSLRVKCTFLFNHLINTLMDQGPFNLFAFSVFVDTSSMLTNMHTPTQHAFFPYKKTKGFSHRFSANSVFRYDLELHVVHVSSSGKIAAIGIVYKYGHPHPFLSKVFKWLSL